MSRSRVILLSQIRCDAVNSRQLSQRPAGPWGQMCESSASSEAGHGERPWHGPVLAGEENQRLAHTDRGLWGYGGEGPCVLGCPGSHLTSQSGNYSEENAFRVETLLTSAPVAKSVCHPSPLSGSWWLVENVQCLPPQHVSPISFTVLNKKTKRSEQLV